MKKALGNILLTLASIVFTLLAAEAVLRIVPLDIAGSAGGDRGYFSRFDPELGWAPLPSVEQYHVGDGFSVSVRQNAMGLRTSQEHAFEDKTDQRRILVLGDSYVWGYGADQEDIFTEPSAHDDDNVEMINLGVSGYGTDQELLFYENLGKQFDVDEVVLAFTTYNDILNNMFAEQYGYQKPYFTNENGLTLHDDHVADRPARRIGIWFRDNSRVVALAETGFLNVKYLWQSRFGDDEPVAHPRDRVLGPGAVRPIDSQGVDLTVQLLKRLRDEVEAAGADFSLVFIPYKPNVLALQAEDHPLVTAMTPALSEAGIDCYDPYAMFVEAARDGASPFNEGDNHFNAKGHEIFGKVITDRQLRETIGVCQ